MWYLTWYVISVTNYDRDHHTKSINFDGYAAHYQNPKTQDTNRLLKFYKSIAAPILAYGSDVPVTASKTLRQTKLDKLQKEYIRQQLEIFNINKKLEHKHWLVRPLHSQKIMQNKSSGKRHRTKKNVYRRNRLILAYPCSEEEEENNCL